MLPRLKKIFLILIPDPKYTFVLSPIFLKGILGSLKKKNKGAHTPQFTIIIVTEDINKRLKETEKHTHTQISEKRLQAMEKPESVGSMHI